MNIKKTLSFLLTFVMLFSFSFTTQSFASENSITPQSFASQNSVASESFTAKLDDTKDTNKKNKSQIEASSIEIPHYVTSEVTFTSDRSFKITTKNIGVSALTNVVYEVHVFDSGNKERASSIRPAGPLGILSTYKDTFSYPGVIIDHIVLTIESTTNTGKVISTTDTIYR